VRALGCEHRRRLVTVERDVGVGEVVHEQELELAGEVDETLQLRRSRDRGRRVVRVRDDDGARPAPARGFLDRVHAGGGGRSDHLRACEPRRDAVDRVRRGGDDDAVARLHQHPHQVCEPLLRADRVHDLGLRVELHTEAACVPLGDGAPQLLDPAARRVAVVAGERGRLAELRHRRLRRADVGVAEAEVDDVASRAAQLALQLVDAREDVRRQVADAPEVRDHRADWSDAGTVS